MKINYGWISPELSTRLDFFKSIKPIINSSLMHKYPLQSKVAKALLGVTGTSISSEYLFSHNGLIGTKLRSRFCFLIINDDDFKEKYEALG